MTEYEAYSERSGAESDATRFPDRGSLVRFGICAEWSVVDFALSYFVSDPFGYLVRALTREKEGSK